MYEFWAEIDLIKYSWPYHRQLLKFGQPFHLAQPQTTINGLQYPQSFDAKGILVAASAVLLSAFLKLKSLVHWLWEYDHVYLGFNDIHDHVIGNN